LVSKCSPQISRLKYNLRYFTLLFYFFIYLFYYFFLYKFWALHEVSSDIVFDETNGSPREQVDLDDVDEDEVPTVAMRTMAIGDVRPQEQ
jgi:hypothetical protein